MHLPGLEWLDQTVNPNAVLDLKTALVAAARDPTSRSRAIAALRSAEFWGATWPDAPEQLRTLTNSDHLTALPLFTDERELQEAGIRYGWLSFDGAAPRRLLQLRDALRAAKEQHAQWIVIDITSEHALELDEGEMELLSASHSSRPAALAPKVRSTPPPPQDTEVKRASGRPEASDVLGASYSALRPRSVTPLRGTEVVAATFGAVPTATMLALVEEPAEDLLEALSGVLRNYPEVEWASLVSSSRARCVALRIEPEFRKNVSKITQQLREITSEHGATYDVLLLDTSEQMKQARNIGIPFYPWRKR